jgi:hypothetical protein
MHCLHLLYLLPSIREVTVAEYRFHLMLALTARIYDVTYMGVRVTNITGSSSDYWIY